MATTPQALYSIESFTADDFEKVLQSLPEDVYIPIEQSGIWSRMGGDDPGRTPYGYFVFREGEEIIATLALDHIVRNVRDSIVSLTGPVFVAPRTPERERRVVATILDHITKDESVKPMYLRVVLMHPEAVPGAVPSIERGYFEREVVVPLKDTPEDLKKTFSSTTRNLINRGRRSGLEARRITEDRTDFFLSVCYPIAEETASRDGFDLLGRGFFTRLLDSFPENVDLYVVYAPVEGGELGEKEPVGWLISNQYHNRAVYYFAGSTRRAQKIGAMPFLINQMLLDLREAGNIACGLTGISSPRWPELKRLERFKLSFSKNIVDAPSLYDIPLRPVTYRGIRAVLKVRAEAPGAARAAKAKGLEAAKKAVSAIRSSSKSAAPAVHGVPADGVAPVDPTAKTEG